MRRLFCCDHCTRLQIIQKTDGPIACIECGIERDWIGWMTGFSAATGRDTIETIKQDQEDEAAAWPPIPARIAETEQTTAAYIAGMIDALDQAGLIPDRNRPAAGEMARRMLKVAGI